MKAIHHGCVAILLGLIALNAYSQSVYRWVDEEGKVHYGDRPPQTQPVEDISDDVKKTNVDTSSQERHKVGKIFAKETEAEKKQREQERRQQEVEAHNRKARCENARKRLQFLQEQPFYIADNQGQGRDVSIEERDRMIAKQQDSIRKNCR